VRLFVVWMVVGGVALASLPSLFWGLSSPGSFPPPPFPSARKWSSFGPYPFGLGRDPSRLGMGFGGTKAFPAPEKIGFLEVFPLVSFDPQGPRFSGATLIWKHPAIPGEGARPSRGCA